MKRLHFQGISIDPVGDDHYTVSPIAEVPSGNFYFLSNDVLSLQPQPQRHDSDTVLCGVANPHFFHVIALAARTAGLKRIVAVDYNYDQLLHFRNMRDLILASDNRIAFLQRLFKVTFNARAIALLNGVRPAKPGQLRGGVEKDPFFALEKELWSNLTFDAAAFQTSYGLSAEAAEAGLLVNSRTVGDIDTYYATMLCGSRSDYPRWPFTAAFGSGFLRDEATFLRLRQLLRQTPLYLLHGDLARLYPELLYSNRYHPMLVWCSNLLCDYFIAKHPAIEEIVTLSCRLGTQVEPVFPEQDLVLLQDERTRRPLPEAIDNRRGRRRPWSIHTRTFAVVCRYLRGGNNLEVIGVPRWFEQDGGESKLPSTSYCMLEHFGALLGGGQRFDTILLHILSGHCDSPDHYRRLLQDARRMTDNLIVLEHNRLSKDFRGTGTGVTLEEMRDLLGAESILDYGSGERCADRNLILVYR
ncbi:hypothetical protein [Geomonas anaerohicana]|uniref:Uncharacterized protein n=1 Tax=Geomonas anaerohicana TaxID=2798583 RepID=A0ABS0YH46_9BACT|nr:hypothetical protein [Geomonas anaerohicana]MBJ6751454.1 hypothetical protein [Geomonas anaerohicana]